MLSTAIHWLSREYEQLVTTSRLGKWQSNQGARYGIEGEGRKSLKLEAGRVTEHMTRWMYCRT